MGNKEKGRPEYVERALSWMYFNRRILQEAGKSSVPVLERMSFLGIYSNNLDEFFRVRMASLSRIAESKEKALKASQEKAKKTIKEINRLNAAYNKEFENTVKEVAGELAAHGIRLLSDTELNDEQKAFVRRLYSERLNGYTNPVWLSEVKELSGTTADDSIWLGVKRTSWHDGRPKSERGPLPVDGLRELYSKLSPLSYRERIDRYSLKPDRADVIVPAARIFLTVAEALGCSTIHVPNISLADSIIDGLYKDSRKSGT